MFFLVIFLTTFKTNAQISLTNGTPSNTQNFNGMNAGTTLPSNWRIQQNASPTWAGGIATLGAQASSGTPTAGATYNWGTTGGTERCAGVMTSGSYASPNSLMSFYTNGGTTNITDFTISYDAERYRVNTAAASVQFYYSTNGTSWTAVTAGDIAAASFPTGSSSYTFGSPLIVTKTGITITSLSIAPSGNFYLRWNLNTTGSSSQGIGIDNVVCTATFATGCTAPTTQATSFSSSSVSTNSGTVSWTRGNGDSIIVVAKQGGAVNADPNSGTSYNANSTFGSGAQIGTGNYVVYKGTGTSVNVTGLLDNTIYHFAIYEYNTTGTCYNLTELTGNFTTLQLIPDIVLNSSNPAISAANLVQGTTNNVIYKFDLSVSTAMATLTGVTINTSGTYAAANLTNLKFWYSTNNTFEPTDSLLSTKTTTLGPGAHIFPSFVNKTINSGLTRYLFVTTDIPCSSTNGNTVIVDAITTANLTFTIGNKTGVAFAGGTQTITSATPNNVTSPSTSNCVDGGTTVSWTAPTGCSSNVLVFAKAGAFSSTLPTGNGISYTANTVFGSGTAFDGGFCVYKGTGSSVNITGLTNGTNYTYKIFTRNDLNWSNGITTNCTPTQSIPDNGCSTNSFAEFPIVSSNGGNITDINVGVKITHPYRGDLKIYLVAPDNTEVLLVNQVGSGADNFDGIIDDQGTAAAFSSGNHTIDATYDVTGQTEGTGVGLLSAFNGKIASGTWKVKVCDNASSDIGNIVSAELFITACTPTATITSFLPTSGPVGTIVTISGTNFSGATGVKFGSVSSVTYTVVNSTTIIAEVPTAALTGKITVLDASSCASSSSTDFTVLNQSGNCSSFNGLIISEVYDSDANNVFNVELYNPTTSSITLDGVYAIAIKADNTGAYVRTINLTGTVAANSVFTAALGSSSQTCSYSYNFTQGGSGINALDGVYLLESSAVLDVTVAPNETGYTILRNTNASGPTATFNSADWTINSTESCADIGSFIPDPTLTITAQPADISACSFTMAVTATGSGLSYQWKFNDSILMTGWDNVTSTNLITANAANSGVTVSGATTNTLTLTGDLANLYNYQFYCEVTSSGCNKMTSSAQFRYDTKPVYRTVTSATGNWTTVANWEMSINYGGTWIPACTYPIGINSTEIYIEPGITLTLDKSIDADYLEIKSGGTLKTTPTTQLTIHNGNSSGADFKVLGTFEDNSNGSNSIVFDPTAAKWEMGANGTIIKTNLSSADIYRSGYQSGMVNMPATATWIYRNNQPTATNNPTVVSAGLYYPNLYFENPTASATDWSNLNSTLRGSALGNCTVYGSLYIGITGNPVKIYNNNTNTLPMLVHGNVTVGSGSEFTIHESASNAGNGTGTGIEIKGNLIVDGIFDINTSTSGITKFSGNGTQTISGGGTMDIWNMELNKPSQTLVDLDRNVEAKNNLNFNSGGIIKTDAFVMTVSNPALTTAVTGHQTPNATGSYNNDKYVFGFLERAINTTGIYEFPIGDAVAGEAYNPVRLDIDAGVGMATAKFVAGAPGTITVPKTDFTCSGSTKFVQYDKMTGEGWWNFVSSTATTFDYNIYLHPNTLNLNSSPNDDTPDQTPGYSNKYRALKAPTGTGGNTWPSSIALAGDPCIVGDYYQIPGFGYSGFSDFAPGGGDANSTPLPIELIYFNAYCNNGNVTLDWATASELNNDYFVVQKSSNGIDFEDFVTIAGAINSNELKEYSTNDINPNSNITYYRLVQVDLDGHKEVFSIVQTDCNNTKENIIVYNGIEGGIDVNIISNSEKEISLNIFDNIGQIIASKVLKTAIGFNHFTFKDKSFAKGLYIVTSNDGTNTTSSKIIIK